MNSRRQRSLPLGGRYRQVSLYDDISFLVPLKLDSKKNTDIRGTVVLCIMLNVHHEISTRLGCLFHIKCMQWSKRAVWLWFFFTLNVSHEVRMWFGCALYHIICIPWNGLAVFCIVLIYLPVFVRVSALLTLCDEGSTGHRGFPHTSSATPSMFSLMLN